MMAPATNAETPASVAPDGDSGVSLPVLPDPKRTLRHSRMGKRRAIVLADWRRAAYDFVSKPGRVRRRTT